MKSDFFFQSRALTILSKTKLDKKRKLKQNKIFLKHCRHFPLLIRVESPFQISLCFASIFYFNSKKLSRKKSYPCKTFVSKVLWLLEIFFNLKGIKNYTTILKEQYFRKPNFGNVKTRFSTNLFQIKILFPEILSH